MTEEKKRNWFARHKFLTGIAVVVLLIGIGSATGGSSGSLDADTNQKQEATREDPAKEEPKKLSSQEIYDKVQPGMTKAEVIRIAGHEPDNCIDSEDDFVGKSSTCSYGTLSLMFINDKLDSKTKL